LRSLPRARRGGCVSQRHCVSDGFAPFGRSQYLMSRWLTNGHESLSSTPQTPLPQLGERVWVRGTFEAMTMRKYLARLL
jgi:hypothetical protein